MDKTREKLEKEKARHAEDRISNLPDVLLTCILSFLSTKDSVRTSVLSTRWKRVWVYVPALDLGDWEFLPRGYDLGNRNKRKDNFLAFVTRFLTQSNIYSCRRFCLRGSEHYDQSLLESWICVAKNPNIEELLLHMVFLWPTREKNLWTLKLSYRPYRPLDPIFQPKNSLPHIGSLCIFANNSPPYVLETLFSLAKEWNFADLRVGNDVAELSFPPSLFSFEKLVVLSQNFVSNVQVPKASIHFPNLKFLCLNDVKFTDDESASNLISSFPVLEELRFLGVHGSLVIISPTLKRLVVGSKNRVVSGDIVIDAPALEFLELRGSFKNLLGHFGAVVTAMVGVQTLHATFEVMRKIPNVKNLSLGDCMGVLEEMDSYDHLTFNHLTRLDLLQSRSWRFTTDLLKMAPCLEDLWFQVMKDEFDFTPEQDVPHCLVSTLRTIEVFIGWISREENVVEVISYFLKNSKVLKQMKIHFLGDCRQEVIKQAVLGIPKGSVSCQIEFWAQFSGLLEERSDA